MHPKFTRKNALQEAINKGKKIQNIHGYVPVSAKCYSGSSTFYAPVVVTGIEIGHCPFKVNVKLDTEYLLGRRSNFSVDPGDFFNKAQEVSDYLAWQEVYGKYKEATCRYDYHGSMTLSQKRRNFSAAMLECKNTKLVAEIKENYSDTDEGLKKMTHDFINENFKKLMAFKFFPEGNGELPEEIDEDE